MNSVFIFFQWGAARSKKKGIPKSIPGPVLLWIAWLLLAAGPICSQSVNGAAGLSNPLDDSLSSARSAAFDSSFVAVADDGSALFWNPAGLGDLPSGEISLHHQVWVADTNQETLLTALPLPGLGGLGFAVDYMNFGSFEGRDPSGAPLPSVSANRIALDGGWGSPWFGNFSAGAGLRLSQENLAGNSYSVLTTEAGVLVRVFPYLRLGLAFTGLGESGPQGEAPLAFNLGAAFLPKLSHEWKLLLSGAGSFQPEGLSRLQAGGELVWQGRYALRAGYQLDLADNQLQGLSGLTLGAGYQWESLSLDYAFTPMGDFGTSHRVSLSYHFQAGGLRSANIPRSRIGEPAWTTGGTSTANSPAALSAKGSTPGPGQSFTGTAAPSSVLPPSGKSAANGSVSVINAASPSLAGEEDSLDIQFKLSPDTLKQGKELEQEGRYPEAIALYNQAIHDDQQNLLAWWGLGNIYYRMGRKDYAVPCFEQVLKIRPDAVGLRTWLVKYRSSPGPRPLP